MEETFMGKYKIEMEYEYKVLPPMEEMVVESTINSYATEGWQVLLFNRTADGKYYTLMFRVKQKRTKT